LKAVLQILCFGSPGSRSVIICTDADPDLDPNINKQKSKKNLDFYYFVNSFLLFIFEKVISKKIGEKIIFCWHLVTQVSQ
jgi:hypothetical protein